MFELELRGGFAREVAGGTMPAGPWQFCRQFWQNCHGPAAGIVSPSRHPPDPTPCQASAARRPRLTHAVPVRRLDPEQLMNEIVPLFAIAV